MAQKGRDTTRSSGGRSARPDPFLHGSERFPPATTSNEEDNEWLVQGRGRARTGVSTGATRLTHPHTTPPNTKQKFTAQHTSPSSADQRAMASAAQAPQRASDPASVASQVQRPWSDVAREPLPERDAPPTSTASAGTPDCTNNNNDDKQEHKQRLNTRTTTRPCAKRGRLARQRPP